MAMRLVRVSASIGVRNVFFCAFAFEPADSVGSLPRLLRPFLESLDHKGVSLDTCPLAGSIDSIADKTLA
jgi:hypothetical protein